MTTYGWIGLGNMGGPMTANVVQAGHTVQGMDVDEQAMKTAADAGVLIKNTIAEVVNGAEVVFTMLPKGQHVRDVFAQDDGIFNTASTDTLLIDSSTVDIDTSRWCHEESAARGFRFIDAPVSGGVSGATAGTLAFMLGGDAKVLEEALPHIEPMSGKTIAAGGATSGIAAKLANNMMLFINLMAAAEGSQLADHLGLDPKVFCEIVSVSSGRSWAQETWYPVPGIVASSAANKNYDATFSVDLALKDVRLAIESGEDAGLALQAAQLVKHQLEGLVEEGLSHKDCSLISKHVTPDGTAPGYEGVTTKTRIQPHAHT